MEDSVEVLGVFVERGDLLQICHLSFIPEA
jgi:hypothetical protein